MGAFSGPHSYHAETAVTSIILNSHHTGLHWFDQDPMNTVTHTPRIFGKQLSTIETVLELATLNIPDSRSLWDLPAARPFSKLQPNLSAQNMFQVRHRGHRLASAVTATLGCQRPRGLCIPSNPTLWNRLQITAASVERKAWDRSLGSSGLSISEPRMGAAFCGQQARSLQVQRVGKTELGEWTAEVGAVARP